MCVKLSYHFYKTDTTGMSKVTARLWILYKKHKKISAKTLKYGGTIQKGMS